MGNLLIVLAVLFGALFLIVPLVEKTAKPVEPEQMQKYQKIFGFLLVLMVVASSIKFCTGA